LRFYFFDSQTKIKYVFDDRKTLSVAEWLSLNSSKVVPYLRISGGAVESVTKTKESKTFIFRIVKKNEKSL
jgi:hypothetical protein